MSPTELEELRTRDRRAVAIHEAGHITVAAALNQDARAYIFDSKEQDTLTFNTVFGKTDLLFCSDEAKPAIGFAGVVAECLYHEVDRSQADKPEAWDIADWVACLAIEPSPTDWELIGADAEEFPTAPIEQAVEILTRQQPLFEWCVGKLIEGGTVTNGMLREAAELLLVED